MHPVQIPFNKPHLTGKELNYIQEAVAKGKLSGNGFFTQACQQLLQEKFGFGTCFLTHSCTGALEMAALLLDIQAGDEVILPSFTFVSTANAFALRGAKLVFADTLPDFPEMDLEQVESLINSKTKAIVIVHYAGFGMQIQAYRQLADKHGLMLIEDAAQAISSKVNEKYLGTFGDLATLSFHETKNIQSGQGGVLIVNNPKFLERARIIWEKGTDRNSFFEGKKNHYSWIDLGSSFQMSELSAAFLWGQMQELEGIQARRKAIWEGYFRLFTVGKSELFAEKYDQLLLKAIANLGQGQALEFQKNVGNYHLFYLLFDSSLNRRRFIEELLSKGVLSVFHYQSLHKSEFIRAHQPESAMLELPNSDIFSERLVRLPFYYDLPEDTKDKI